MRERPVNSAWRVTLRERQSRSEFKELRREANALKE
jgi:hypothetical protein